MNERIKELIEQSTERYLDWGGENERTELNAEKLADLIVRECVKVAHPKLTDVGEWAAGMRLVQQRLKQHFGVEE
jgi:hypothetical protein